jgi:hypothetical protein
MIDVLGIGSRWISQRQIRECGIIDEEDGSIRIAIEINDVKASGGR